MKNRARIPRGLLAQRGYTIESFNDGYEISCSEEPPLRGGGSSLRLSFFLAKRLINSTIIMDANNIGGKQIRERDESICDRKEAKLRDLVGILFEVGGKIFPRNKTV